MSVAPAEHLADLLASHPDWDERNSHHVCGERLKSTTGCNNRPAENGPSVRRSADVAIQLNGARGYSKDTLAEWVYRAARLVDGADEVHKVVLAKFMREEGRDFWMCSAGNRV